MFLENESELCECRATVFFGGISLRQPVWSFNQSCKDFSPEDEKKKIQQQQNQKTKKGKERKKNESVDL